jgi:hypothetical protein
MKCSNHFGTKRHGLLKVIIVLAPKGAIQNYMKNIRYDISPFLRGCLHVTCECEIRESVCKCTIKACKNRK